MQFPKMSGTLSFMQVRILRYPHPSEVKNTVLRGKLKLLQKETELQQ